MTQPRKTHWEESLSIYIANARENPFTWGTNDCAHFAFGAVLAITGEDFVAGFSGQYATWREAAQWLRDNGYRSFAEGVTDRLGEPVHPAMAGRGDVVLKRVGNGNILGVCVGKHSWFLGDETIAYDNEGRAITQPALVSWPTLLCDVAWKVGTQPD